MSGARYWLRTSPVAMRWLARALAYHVAANDLQRNSIALQIGFVPDDVQ